MTLRAAITLLCIAPAIASADTDEAWRKTLTPVQPGPFPLPRPATLTYGFGWEGIRAATAVFTFTTDEAKDLVTLNGNVSTEGFVRSLWKLDGSVLSRLQASTLRSIQTKQIERYRSRTKTTEMKFLPDRVIETRSVKPAGKKIGKKKPYKLPDLLDMHGGLLFLRSLPLNDGDRIDLLVYPGAAPYLMRVTVEGRESLTVKAGTFDAIRGRVELWKVDRDHSLKPHRKFESATAWLSDDRDRRLLKVKARVFVGSVWGELEKVAPVAPDPDRARDGGEK